MSAQREPPVFRIPLVALVMSIATGIACQPATPPAQSPPVAQPVPYGTPMYGAPYGAPAVPGAPAPAYQVPSPAPYVAPSPVSPPSPTPVPSARPLLGAIVGAAAWQAESRAVVREVVANLRPDYQARVANVPIVFDPNTNDVNAFAACDDGGAPFVAATEGLLEAIDAISQTKATDEIYGTQAYAAYANFVAPRLASTNGGGALLPAGIIAAGPWADPRRVSRAHEIFDEIVAFTFGHELSHHYLGHTGCAMGANGIAPAIAALGQLLTSVAAWTNQPNEIAADSNGCISTLDTGRARSSFAYRWTEEGGLWLLYFFGYLDRASGGNPLVSFLRTHPNPMIRIPIVQTVAAGWRLQHGSQ
jgi:hypothetical protein